MWGLVAVVFVAVLLVVLVFLVAVVMSARWSTSSGALPREKEPEPAPEAREGVSQPGPAVQNHPMDEIARMWVFPTALIPAAWSFGPACVVPSFGASPRAAVALAAQQRRQMAVGLRTCSVIDEEHLRGAVKDLMGCSFDIGAFSSTPVDISNMEPGKGEWHLSARRVSTSEWPPVFVARHDVLVKLHKLLQEDESWSTVQKTFVVAHMSKPSMAETDEDRAADRRMKTRLERVAPKLPTGGIGGTDLTSVGAEVEGRLVARLHTALKEIGVKRVVVWGWKLHSHTHSYIHAAYVSTLRAAKVPVVWKWDGMGEKFSLQSGDMFITMGNAHNNVIPHKNAWYVLHNCAPLDGAPRNRQISQQVFHKRLADSETFAERVDNNPWQRINKQGDVSMAWATDLLPSQFLAFQPAKAREQVMVWCGTIARDERYNNWRNIRQFLKGCKEEGVGIRVMPARTSNKKHTLAVQKALLAPCLVGPWQQAEEYVPCRFFKNVSYGALPVTNAAIIGRDAGASRVLYDRDPRQGALRAIEAFDNGTAEDMWSACARWVQSEHTYLSRLLCLVAGLQRRQKRNGRKR